MPLNDKDVVALIGAPVSLTSTFLFCEDEQRYVAAEDPSDYDECESCGSMDTKAYAVQTVDGKLELTRELADHD